MSQKMTVPEDVLQRNLEDAIKESIIEATNESLCQSSQRKQSSS